MYLIAQHHRVFLLFSFIPEIDDEQKVIGALTIAKDLTPLRRSEQALSQREQELRTLVDNLPISVVRYDEQYRRIFFNPSFLKTFSTSAEKIYGSTPKQQWFATNITGAQFTEVLETAKTHRKNSRNPGRVAKFNWFIKLLCVKNRTRIR
ncbi:hypothetical protein [Methylocucumis oryzae]|uniref:hypothetical protein n=1 Tax=Methylocucumis oryzae TaxID=1632867 RepID=UPI00103D1273|nr:hypothetical protein [Methylocucumis oryzae]